MRAVEDIILYGYTLIYIGYMMYSKAVRWLRVVYLVPMIVSYDDGEMMAALVVLFSRCSCIGDGLLCIVVVSAIVHLR